MPCALCSFGVFLGLELLLLVNVRTLHALIYVHVMFWFVVHLPARARTSSALYFADVFPQLVSCRLAVYRRHVVSIFLTSFVSLKLVL